MKNYADALESHLILAEEGFLDKFKRQKKSSNKQTSQKTLSITNPNYTSKYPAHSKLMEIIKSPGFLPKFSGSLENDSDGAKFANYLNLAFSKISKHSQFGILLKEIYSHAEKDGDYIPEDLDANVYKDIKFLYSDDYSNALAFDYDFEEMSQDAFFYIDFETEAMLNIIVKHALGSDYIGKCYSDDSAVFTVVKKK